MKVQHLGVSMYVADKRECERILDGFFLETFAFYDTILPSKLAQAIAAKMEKVLETELANFFKLENAE